MAKGVTEREVPVVCAPRSIKKEVACQSEDRAKEEPMLDRIATTTTEYARQGDCQVGGEGKGGGGGWGKRTKEDSNQYGVRATDHIENRRGQFYSELVLPCCLCERGWGTLR